MRNINGLHGPNQEMTLRLYGELRSFWNLMLNLIRQAHGRPYAKLVTRWAEAVLHISVLNEILLIDELLDVLIGQCRHGAAFRRPFCLQQEVTVKVRGLRITREFQHEGTLV